MKHVLLNRYSGENRTIAEEVGVRTNDYFVGILYTGHMTSTTVTQGLSAAANRLPEIVEVLLHPCIPLGDPQERFIAPYLSWYVNSPARLAELETLTNPAVLGFVREQDWRLTSFRTLASGDQMSDTREKHPMAEPQLPTEEY
jgi:hypothetical protein